MVAVVTMPKCYFNVQAGLIYRLRIYKAEYIKRSPPFCFVCLLLFFFVFCFVFAGSYKFVKILSFKSFN